jgi:phosphoribosyl-ATP pyrophosphohydrolase
VYCNSVDAFRQLVSPTVSQISAKTGCMQNGIVYSIVNVLFAKGEEYRIEAYGEEASELYKAASEQSALLCLP